jgi:hypothetical protein
VSDDDPPRAASAFSNGSSSGYKSTVSSILVSDSPDSSPTDSSRSSMSTAASDSHSRRKAPVPPPQLQLQSPSPPTVVVTMSVADTLSAALDELKRELKAREDITDKKAKYRRFLDMVETLKKASSLSPLYLCRISR